VGIAGMLATIKEAETYGLSYDVVDDLTGKKLGRASSGTFRTADVVGLDTMAHVIKTLQDNLGEGKTPVLAPSYATPPVLAALIEKGALGQKAGAGFYKKAGKDILRLDPTKADYVPAGGKADPIVDRMLKKPAAERLKLLRESSKSAGPVPVGHPARRLPLRSRAPGFDRRQRARHRLRDALGLRHEAGPVRAVAGSRLAAGGGVGQGRHRSRQGAVQGAAAGLGVRWPHRRAHAQGSWSAARQTYVPRSELPVYRRQYFAESVVNSGAVDALKAGTEVFKNDEMRLWTLDGEVLIASITSKLHLIGTGVSKACTRPSSWPRPATRAW
jgi:3-hydroxyacyl-CoA dehydrogenase